MPRRNRPEEQLQRAVAEYLDHTGLLWCHVPNERSNPVERKILSGLGVKRGVPDVLIFDYTDEPSPWDSIKFSRHGLAIELKAKRNRPTDAQEQWLEQLEQAGWRTAVCRSLDEVVELVEQCYPHVKSRIS